MNSDMTKYCYQHFENAYNIGWNTNFDSTVESKETFNSIFIEKLTSYCENPLNSDLNGVCRETEIDGKKYVKGFGEIRIIDLKKKIRYAAPNVIIDDILSCLLYTSPSTRSVVRSISSLLSSRQGSAGER